MTISKVKRGKNWKGNFLEIVFVAFTEDSSIVTNNTQGPLKYPLSSEIALGIHFHI